MSLPRKFSPKNKLSGEVLIGIIIALGIFMILSQAVMTLAFSAYDLVSYTRARISARHIALEEMETIRNVAYEDVGTIGGIPTGVFEQERQVLRNGQNYTVRTNIIYIDDPFDGVAPADTLAADYKRVKVDVSWGGIAESNFSEVSFTSDISPRGIETTAGGGTLSVLVFNSDGLPVPQAEVHIVSTTTTPPIDAFYFTSDLGRVTLPGFPICNSCYQITVTKDGMSTDRTYSTSEVENPIKPPASVLEAQLTEVSFAIDEFARLTISSVNAESESFDPLPNQVIRIHGQKQIGTDGLDDPVYKFDQEIVTDSQGSLAIEEIEWDNYSISLPEDSTSDIAYTNPLVPLSIVPNDEINLNVALTSDTDSSLTVSIKNSSDELIASAAATLKDSEGFEASTSSGVEGSPNFGQVFFSGLENKLYTIIATASGYLTHESNVIVSNDTSTSIILNTE